MKPTGDTDYGKRRVIRKGRMNSNYRYEDLCSCQPGPSTEMSSSQSSKTVSEIIWSRDGSILLMKPWTSECYNCLNFRDHHELFSIPYGDKLQVEEEMDKEDAHQCGHQEDRSLQPCKMKEKNMLNMNLTT